ncbi:MAG TPA: MBL fold metallo-hydrolase [Xanthobacteraceae bacterium]|nr:MBL fold metallo-hydrolase [Xanthobacteraceae bacterium]
MIKIGDIEVHRIEEVMLAEPITYLLGFNRESFDENLDWLVPHYYTPATETFPTSVHSWLIKTPTNTILVDTCGGNGKNRPASPRFHLLNTPYLDRIKVVGITPDKIDTVVLTHLHIDHVGWNTRRDGGKWVPTFPNAQYVMSKIERDAWDPARGAKDRPENFNLPFVDSVQPILDAGLARLVDGSETLFEGIDLMLIPGHAPGMIALRVRSRGEEALFAGDIAHQPIQIAQPDWSTKYCSDPKLAAATRRRILNYCADTGCLLLPVHFGRPYCGRIARRGNGFAFQPHDQEP